jgi:hypothetical protein
MTRRHLSLVLAIVLMTGVVAAVGAGAALGQTPPDVTTVTLSQVDPTPSPQDSTATFTITIHLGSDVPDGTWQLNFQSVFESPPGVSIPWPTPDGLSFVSHVGGGYPGESCVEPGMNNQSCWWDATKGGADYVFTATVGVAADATPESLTQIRTTLSGIPGLPSLPQGTSVLEISAAAPPTTSSTTTTTSPVLLTPLCDVLNNPGLTDDDWIDQSGWYNSWPVDFGGARIVVTPGSTVYVHFDFGEGGTPHEASIGIGIDPVAGEWSRFYIEPPGDGVLTWTFDGTEKGFYFQMIDRAGVPGALTMNCYESGVEPSTTTTQATTTTVASVTTTVSSSTLPNTGLKQEQFAGFGAIGLALVAIGVVLLGGSFVSAQARLRDK